MIQQELFNIKQTAEILGSSRWEVSDMCKTGELPYIPWRGSRKAKRISRQAIMRYIKEHEVGSPEELLAAFDGRRRESKRRATA